MNPNQQLPYQPPQRKKPHKFFRVFLVVAVVTGVLLALLYRQQLVDQFVVWQHPATSDITTVGSRAGLNSTGIFYLAASRTGIVDRTTFNNACGSLLNEKTVILGCYDPASKRIFVYNIDDQQLDGIRETTASHEMLHAAYDRLLPYEKPRIERLLQEQRKKITDQRILDLIASYEQSEPTEIVNELHSIFGTEVRSLTPELEQYYRRYFSDRQKVIDLKEKYEQVFSDLENRQNQLVSELDNLAASVNTRSEQYELDLATFNDDVETFNSWAATAAVSESDFYARRSRLVARGDELETTRQGINSDIERYNSLKRELDSLNLQAEELNHSIDSKWAAAPTAL